MVVAERLGVGYERRLVEFSYLDARGMGLFEGTNASAGFNASYLFLQ